MKAKLVAVVIGSLLASGAGAQENRPFKVQKSSYQEELKVYGKDLSKMFEKEKGAIITGIGSSAQILIHVYDKKTDTWKYVGTKKNG